MAITADAVGLIFKAKGDTDDAKKAYSDLRGSITKDVDAIEGTGKTGFAKFADSIGLGTVAAGGLGNALPIVGAAAAAMGTAIIGAAVAGTKALFDLTTQASEFGSEIFDASEKTGLSAQTLSALKFQADQSGSSLEAVTGSLGKFARTIGDAANGSEKAQAKLERLGVTSTDLDTALGQALATIVKLPPGIQQMTAAQDAFGKSGVELLPLIKSFDGDLAELVKTAKELGVTIDDEAARAADEFGDQMDTLGAQIGGITRTIGFSFMPVFLDMAKQVSGWAVRNQEEIKQWANNFALSVEAAKNRVSAFVTELLEWKAVQQWLMINTLPAQFLEWATGVSGERERLRKEREIAATHDETLSTFPLGVSGKPKPPPTSGIIPTDGGKKRSGASAADKARREAEQEAAKELRAAIDIELDKLKDAEAEFKKISDKLTEAFKKTGDAKKFVQEADAALEKYRLAIEAILPALTELENQQAGTLGPNAAEKLRRAQEQRVADLQAGMNEAVDKNNALIVDSHEKAQKQILDISHKTEKEQADIEKRKLDLWRKQQTEILERELENAEDKIEATVQITRFLEEQAKFDRDYIIDKNKLERDERVKQIEDTVKDETRKRELIAALDELYKQKALLAEEEFQQRRNEIAEKYAIPVTPAEGEEAQSGGFFGGLIEGLGTSVDEMLKKVEPLKGIGNIIGSQFNLIASAVGNAVRAFVLFGTAGGSFKKFAAEMLASIAQMAITQALWELAQGFAMLALAYFGHPTAGASATAHFVAAGVYAAIGGVAAIAGRAVAGDSFQKETSGAFGSAGSAAGTSRDTSGQGRAFSSRGDEAAIVEVGANQAGLGTKDEVKITFTDDTDWFSRMFKLEYYKGGPVREIVANQP